MLFGKRAKQKARRFLSTPFAKNPERKLVCELQINSLWTFTTAVGLSFERNFLAVVQTWQASVLNSSDVNEDVCCAVVRSNEAKAFALVEEFYGTCSHLGELP